MLFIEKSRLKSKYLNRSCVGKFRAKLFKKPTKRRNGALSQSGASTVCRSANQNRVILPSIEGKLGKNALCLNQSAFSNFALYVIKLFTGSFVYEQVLAKRSQLPFVLNKAEVRTTFVLHSSIFLD